MNAIEILKKDHQEVMSVLQTILKTKTTAVKTREKLIKKLYSLVKLHSTIEEKLIYPTGLAQAKLEKITRESLAEHEAVDILFKKILKVEVNDENWLAKCNVIKENLEHHIDEEEKNLFPILNKLLSEEDLKDMGNRILLLKQKQLIEA